MTEAVDMDKNNSSMSIPLSITFNNGQIDKPLDVCDAFKKYFAAENHLRTKVGERKKNIFSYFAAFFDTLSAGHTLLIMYEMLLILLLSD